MAGQGRPKSLDPVQLRKFRKKVAPRVEEVFERTSKLVREQVKRTEELMFSDAFWNPTLKTGIHSSMISSELVKLGNLVSKLGDLYIKLQKQAKENADLMTFDEKLKAVADFLVDLGAKQRLYALQTLYPVIHTLEGKPNTLRRKQAKEIRDEAIKPNDNVSPEGS